MDLGREGFVTAGAEKTDPGQKQQWWLPLWKGNPVCLIAEVFWAQRLVLMSPFRLSKAFSLPGGCRKDQAMEGRHSSAAEPVAQTMKEIGLSSSKKWWSSPIFWCMSRGVWAWRAEPWQREVGMWSRGAGEVAGELGGCDPSGSLLPWHSCPAPGGHRGKRGFPVSPAKAKGLFVSERINQCLVCDVQVHHAQHCSSP